MENLSHKLTLCLKIFQKEATYWNFQIGNTEITKENEGNNYTYNNWESDTNIVDIELHIRSSIYKVEII